ncbi:hypothetical protein [Novosphingobium terrae]|uniref:hypothetical protein n=1 Tax=Novosphingobium terrae TaxID=2726189 RepID=UPI00197E7397|nr:hypothetical protein [Novosphingobium terrae]
MSIRCADSAMLHGHVCVAKGRAIHGNLIIHGATRVLARYDHRYAHFLTTHGFDMLTYDYREIQFFRHQRFEQHHPAAERQDACDHVTKVTAPTLVIAVADDEISSVAALWLILNYHHPAARTPAYLRLQDYALSAIGRFALFYDRHRGACGRTRYAGSNTDRVPG